MTIWRPEFFLPLPSAGLARAVLSSMFSHLNCLQCVYWNVTLVQSATSTTQPNSATVSNVALRPIGLHPTKFVTIMSQSIFPSFFTFLSFFYLSYFFSPFYFFLFSVRFSSYNFHCPFLSLLRKLRPRQQQKTTSMPMALTFKFPATNKSQTIGKRCNASHEIHYLTRCQSTHGNLHEWRHQSNLQSTRTYFP